MLATQRKSAADPRLIAARVLRDVLKGRSLSDLLPERLNGLDDPRDRALAQELCYGVMRGYPRLQALDGLLLKKPLKAKDQDLQALILIGLYQLSEMRVAAHAAIHETAGAAGRLGKRWGVGLINGVLRNFQRQQAVLQEKVDRQPSSRYAMPDWLLQRIEQRWPDSWQERIAALSARPPMSLRINCRQVDRGDYLERLWEQQITAEPVPHTESGLTLQRPVDVLELPGFSDGAVSVQDGGAQLAAPLLELQPGQRVLDACAAPGGKTGHMLELADDLRLTAIDLDPQRLQRVAENLQRLGLQAELQAGDAAHPQGRWAERQYDRILLDVPCSATGVMRRHPDIKYLRSEADIDRLGRLQGQILDAIWPLLKPGGLLLYATCSLLPQENEQQLEAFLQRCGDAREQPIEAGWGEPRCVGRQIAPGQHGMDGFYYARLQRVPG